MIHYIVQTLAFQALFLIVYDLFLRKETFFNCNRTYLLATPILSFVIPFIKIDAIQQSVGQDFAIQLPAVFIGNSPFIEQTITSSSNSWFSWSYLWGLGAAIALIYFAKKLNYIFGLARQGEVMRFEQFTVIKMIDSAAAFTFFRTIFLGENLKEEQREIILQHEQVHIKQWHTIDLLFFEILKIICWFNPLVYIYQHRLKVVHEFIADQHVAAQEGRSKYYQELLSQVFNTQDVSFINTFFNHSLIKKRILMLQKSKSRSTKLIKFAMVLPLLAAMILYVSCSEEPDKPEAELDSSANSEVMTKINELSDAIMKKGNLTDEEAKALEFLATPYKEGDKVYGSVEQYLKEEAAKDLAFDNDKGKIAFAKVDKVPTYPGCSGDNEALKSCMVKKISQLIGAEFNTKVGDALGLTGRQRIAVTFTIDTSGQVANIVANAQNQVLMAEAQRVIAKIPTMIPGEHEGKKVAVKYSVPIIFEIE